MPAVLQASISSVPAGAVTFLPSTVSVTSAIRISEFVIERFSDSALPIAKSPNRSMTQHWQLFHRPFFFVRARSTLQMILKLFAKLFHERNGRHRRRIAQ